MLYKAREKGNTGNKSVCSSFHNEKHNKKKNKTNLKYGGGIQKRIELRLKGRRGSVQASRTVGVCRGKRRSFIRKGNMRRM